MKKLHPDVNFLNFFAMALVLFGMWIMPIEDLYMRLKGHVWLGVGFYLSGIIYATVSYRLYKKQSLSTWIAIPLFLLCISTGIPIYEMLNISQQSMMHIMINTHVFTSLLLLAIYFIMNKKYLNKA